MVGGYKKIFWALFLVTFHLNLGPLQLLPPFVGWLVLLSGLQEITKDLENILSLPERSSLRESFQRGRTFGWILVGLTLMGTLGSLGTDGSIMDSSVFTFYPILVTTMKILTIFYILEGTHEVFSSLGFTEQEKETEEKLQIYLLIMIPSALLLTFSLFFNHSAGMFMGALLGIAAVIYLLVYFNRLKKFWMEDPLENPQENLQENSQENLQENSQ